MMTAISSKRRRTEEGTYHIPELSRHTADSTRTPHHQPNDSLRDLLDLMECYTEPEPLSSNNLQEPSMDPFPCDFSSNAWKDCRMYDCEPLLFFPPPSDSGSNSSLNHHLEEDDSLLAQSRKVVDPFETEIERESLLCGDDGYESDTESDKDDLMDNGEAMTSCEPTHSRSQRQEEWRSSQQEHQQPPQTQRQTPEPDVSELEVYMNDQQDGEESHRLMDVLGLDREGISEKEHYSSSISCNPQQEEHQVQMLKQLTLVSRLEWSLPLSVLSRVMQRASHLKSLSLFSIAMQGDKQDFEAFARALQQHSNLEEFNLVDCCLIDSTIAIDPLLRALAVLPTLRSVKINACDLERQASPNTGVRWMNPLALASLGSSKSITTLSLEDLDLSDDHIQEFSTALKNNITLEHLTCWDCNMSDQAGQCMADMLKFNGAIQKVDFSLNDFGDGALQAMGQALRVNQTLWSLSLHGSNPNPPKNSSRTKRHRHSTSTKCTKPSNSSPSYDELLHVLREHNHVLREVILEYVEDPRVDLYVMLNRNRHILENEAVTRCRLVDCLAEHAVKEASGKPENVLLFSRPPSPPHPAPDINLSFSFCLLQANPELCDTNR